MLIENRRMFKSAFNFKNKNEKFQILQTAVKGIFYKDFVLSPVKFAMVLSCMKHSRISGREVSEQTSVCVFSLCLGNLVLHPSSMSEENLHNNEACKKGWHHQSVVPAPKYSVHLLLSWWHGWNVMAKTPENTSQKKASWGFRGELPCLLNYLQANSEGKESLTLLWY